MSKHKEYFEEMLNQHKDLFNEFDNLHTKYASQPEEWQKEYNEKGQTVLEVIRRYENMLCSQSEGGKYGKFSTKLSEKFWEVIRTRYPKIDYIGLT